MVDFLFDYIDCIVVGIFIIVLFGVVTWAFESMEKEEQQCEKNGGIFVRTYRSYTCLTKEDIEKLRGGK